MRSVYVVAFAIGLAATGAAQTGASGIRVFAGSTSAPIDVPALAARLADSDVVFLAPPSDAADSRARIDLFEAISAQRGDIAVALGVLTRDAQDPLDHFLMGHSEEREVLAAAGAWPEYARDYKPILDVAVRREWPVVAGAPPRASGGKDAPAAVADDVLAESITQSYAAGSIGGKRPLIVVLDRPRAGKVGDGAAALVATRLAGKRVTTVLFVNVAGSSTPGPNVIARADYVVGAW